MADPSAYIAALLPFNDIARLSFLGELGFEASIYPMIIGVALFLILANKYFRKQKSFFFLLAFLCWLIVSGLVNGVDITRNYTKGRSGVEKYIFQLIVFVFMFLSALYIYKSLKGHDPERIFKKIHLVIIYSFLGVALYSLFEIFHLFGIKLFEPLYNYFSGIIHNDNLIFLDQRLRAVSREPSWFAHYIAFVYPWLLSYPFLKDKNIKWLCFILLIFSIILVAFTFSRTAYAIVAFESIVFSLLLLLYGKTIPVRTVV